MVQYCAVPGCKSSAKTCGVSFHKFPKHEFLRQLWISKLRRKPNKNVSSNMRICSLHFSTEDIVISKNGKLRMLRPGAVPQTFNSTSPTRKQQLECSSVEHFEENQFEQNRADGRKMLKRTAIPTIFNVKNSDSVKSKIDSKSSSKSVQAHDSFSRENVVGVKIESSADNESNQLQEKNTISTNIIYLKPAESRETSKNILSPLQIQENFSQVVDPFVHKAVSYRDSVVAQTATSESQSSDDTERTESVVSEVGSDESVNESIQENEDASVQKKNSYLTKRISELESENEELQKENKKLREEIKKKDECLTYLSELLKFSSVKSENEVV